MHVIYSIYPLQYIYIFLYSVQVVLDNDLDDPSDTELSDLDRSHARLSSLWALWKDMALYNKSHRCAPDCTWHSYIDDQMARLGWIYYIDCWRKVPPGRTPSQYMNDLARAPVDYDNMSSDELM